MADDTKMLVQEESAADSTLKYQDKSIIRDERYLRNLLLAEEAYVPACDYLAHVQTDIKAHMRKTLAIWMYEVCDDLRCEEEIFPLSMNYLDRVLATTRFSKMHLQLLGTACIFIASKFRQNRSIPAGRLVLYTDNSITTEELLMMELLVLNKLGWDVSTVMPNDFTDYLLNQLGFPSEVEARVRRHAHTFIALCYTDYRFALLPPSMISAVTLSSAVTALQGHIGAVCPVTPVLLTSISVIAGIDAECLLHVQRLFEILLSEDLHTQLAVNGIAAGSSTVFLTPPADEDAAKVCCSAPDLRHLLV